MFNYGSHSANLNRYRISLTVSNDNNVMVVSFSDSGVWNKELRHWGPNSG